MINTGRDLCIDRESSFSREWLETNGIGGYASGTVAGANTRRYHGLLVAATRPPLGRMVLLSKFEEALIIGDVRFELSSNQYPDTIDPNGYGLLTDFRRDPFPIWTYDVNGIRIERTVFMVDGENTTVCRWSVLGEPTADIRLELRPLLAFRDHHHLRHEDASFDRSYQSTDGLVSLTPYPDLPTLHLENNAAEVHASGYWYRDFEYAIEKERGFDHREDLFQPCVLHFDLSEPAVVIASCEERRVSDHKEFETAEIRRRARLIATSERKDAVARQLVLAADQFIVRRGSGHTVIAGYHWFSDWGRDTMIALTGLTLTTKRPDIAGSILLEFSHQISQGMLPNRFPDAGEQPEYNTVDATLWYFEAIRAYVAASGDLAFVRSELFDKLVDIIDWHIRGTRYGIRVDSDGLLMAGGPGTQLTWMDAKVGDDVITPRFGKPVEIQALWFNALCIMADLADQFDDAAGAKQYRSMAAQAKAAFRRNFWNDDDGCLFDVIDGDKCDASVRPNQIFAVSLRHTMIDAATARKVVKKVEDELLTPFGLRSLSPRDPRYVGRYEGPPDVRDAAYHQGTVWSWLIGPFIDAYRRTHSNDARASRRIAEILAPLTDHLTNTMLGNISEIFDADAPHSPRGAAAQAWSVAELLRVTTFAA
ncbi:MAG: glycogen debranching enzyme family protein [Pyrinomonadaceae bacterium]|nr:glycogen debranching enzyme family protein [Pyrinomonadaceae bacterium]